MGSKAVPGCAGKGMIDLMFPFRGDELGRLKRKLTDLGFKHQSARNLFPEGRPMRVGSIEHDGDSFRLHVVPADSGEPEEL